MSFEHQNFAPPLQRGGTTRKGDHIPQSELLKKYRGIINATNVQEAVGVQQLIDPHSTNDWDVLIRKTSHVLQGVEAFDSAKRSNIGQGTVDAKVLWFRSAMKDTIEAEEKGRLRELDLQNVNGMRVVIGRAKTGLRQFFGQNFLPVIMGSTRVAELIMT